MQKGDFLTTILKSEKTVFTTKDIAMLWQADGSSAMRERLRYYVKNGDLYRIRKGFYAKNGKYNQLELATRIFTPAYVSFETVLAKEGLVFQYYDKVTVASYVTRNLTVDGRKYSLRKIKDSILLNPTDINQIDNFSIATKERAFLDTLYIHPYYHFDNIRSLDWQRVFAILPIYENQRMNNAVRQLYEDQKE